LITRAYERLAAAGAELLPGRAHALCGDESGRTQQGHVNAYDQDNGRSWLEWELTPERQPS